MAAPTWADVLLLAPDLSAVPTDNRAAILADVATILSNASYWPTSAMHVLAQKYLAAHLGALVLRATGGGSSAGSGAVQTEAVGDVSVSYTNPLIFDPTAAAYMTTFWGTQLVALSRRSSMRVGMVA